MPDGRPFFVIGQWSGPDLTIWQIQQASDDPDEAYEEIRWDAWDADGGVEIVYAASATEAEATARNEAAQTAERIRQDLTRQRARRNRTSRRRRKVRHHYSQHASRSRAAAGRRRTAPWPRSPTSPPHAAPN
ncbi:hypothetical protein ACFRIC_38825 [Streptomyces sp. NPDC056738]|uniref:hypothetical protein n=1 Tax=Streptomyces sp. NPDC056738 TaxID=3345933 RepID=UPI0036AA05C0